MCSKNIGKFELKKILIIGAKNVSDNLLLTPSIKRIKETFPSAKLDIVTSLLSEEFVVDNTLIEEYFFYDKENIFKFINKVCSKRYDLIIAFHLPFLPYILRGKYKLSFFLKSCFSEKIFTHESERMLNFIEPFLGKENKSKLYFNSSKKNKDKIEKLMKSFGIKNSDVVIVINPGQLGSIKNFKEELFIEIIEELFKIYDSKIIIAGTHLKERYSRKVLHPFKKKDIFDLTGKLSLRDYFALLEKSDLIITPDTTSMHLASAAGCPIVALFGPGNPYRYGPFGVKNLVVHSNIPCFPCDVTKRCNHRYKCLEVVTSEKIIKAATLLINEKEEPFLFEI